ncbi:MAG: glutamate--tRNA ligase [Rhodospirillaceae bacterium]|nr:glutamate--tRNA ligase [Rhodospirillaceae bacterium]
MTVVTRFAPSPTGFLHIGGARTALFNWLFARHVGGLFRLRIEDTDRARSTPAATQAILDGLTWLELDWDGETVYQFARAERHAAVVREMLASGHAYHCFATPEELAQMREAQKAAGQSIRYDGRWRDRDPAEAPPGAKPVLRLKAPTEGETVVEDLVQGTVRVANAQLDDMVLLRADGTPTYMLSVVVDDHDMGVTHVIRGDDHLTNAFRQSQIYRAMGWDIPRFAHIPLIHGADGAKLSKRHGALGVDAYRDMGMLPAAMRNYLLRLGWGHGDVDIISTADAVALFDIADIGRAPSRFDMAKLLNMNGHYIRAADDAALLRGAEPFMTAKLGRAPTPAQHARVMRGMPGLKQRAKTLIELADAALFYCHERPIPIAEKAKAMLNEAGLAHLRALAPAFAAMGDWTEHGAEAAVKAYVESRGIKMGEVAQPLRAALTGQAQSPGLFEVMAALGREEALGRLADAVK